MQGYCRSLNSTKIISPGLLVGLGHKAPQVDFSMILRQHDIATYQVFCRVHKLREFHDGSGVRIQALDVC